MTVNIYKPRYKISFLAKSKVWSYKDSRLRRFFNIRGRKLVRRGLFKRYVIVFNNMKWTIARRYIRPFMRRRSAVKRRYKTAFYNKQQLRHFYGKIREETFRNFFKNHLVGVNTRNNSYYSALECRADMFLFRTRLLPTLYAAKQFVQHQGIELNDRIEKSSNALVRPGTILTFDSKYWKLFSDFLDDRIYFRLYGTQIWEKRAFTRLKKKVRWISRVNRKKVKKEYFLLRKLYSLKSKIKPQFKKFIQHYLNKITSWEIKKVNQNKVFNIKFSKELKEFLKEIDSLRKEIVIVWEELNKIKITNFKIKRQKRHFRNFNLKWEKNHIKKSIKTWRLSQANFLKSISNIVTIYTKINNLFFKAKLLELNYRISFIKKAITHENILENKDNNLKLKSLLEKTYEHSIKRKNHLVEKNMFLLEKFKKLLEPIIRRRIRYRRWWRPKFNRFKFGSNNLEQKEILVRKTALYYFLIYRRFKANRKLSIPRLKSVHWYIPRYIYFDFKSLRAVFLHNPLPEEIHYSFKCSLPKIHSFYRSIGV